MASKNQFKFRSQIFSSMFIQTALRAGVFVKGSVTSVMIGCNFSIDNIRLAGVCAMHLGGY